MASSPLTSVSPRRVLRTFHIATAMVGGLLNFGTFDARQGIAAEEMGLTVCPT